MQEIKRRKKKSNEKKIRSSRSTLFPLWQRIFLNRRGHRVHKGDLSSRASSPAIHCSSPMSQRIRVFATCDIGDALNILRDKGYDVEVYPWPEAPPKSLILEKVKSRVDGLITTLRDP